jgi:DNA-binding SARP family transcriptional activator
VEHERAQSLLRTNQVAARLLAFLLLHRQRSHRREVLAGLFWGDRPESQARRCLNTALWRLRNILEPEGVPSGTYLLADRIGEIGFNWSSDYWLDTAVFEDQVDRVLDRPVDDLSSDDVDRTDAVLDLCTGEFLEGIFDDWALQERERLRNLYLRALRWLMRCHRQQGNLAGSLACGQRILACDPLREDVHREMMRLYRDSGQRAQALRQYEICRQQLAKEMGIEPMPETQFLFASLKNDLGDALSPSETAAGAPDQLEQVLQLLQQAARDSSRANLRLQQAVTLLQRGFGTPQADHPLPPPE